MLVSMKKKKKRKTKLEPSLSPVVFLFIKVLLKKVIYTTSG